VSSTVVQEVNLREVKGTLEAAIKVMMVSRCDGMNDEGRKDKNKTEGFHLHLSALFMQNLERETRLELATSTLARSRSTTELFPRRK
jgi:hypothetical protein